MQKKMPTEIEDGTKFQCQDKKKKIICNTIVTSYHPSVRASERPIKIIRELINYARIELGGEERR